MRLSQKGLTEEDALMNARLAKILTSYDYHNGPILWTPTDADNDTDNGTEFKMRRMKDLLESS